MRLKRINLKKVVVKNGIPSHPNIKADDNKQYLIKTVSYDKFNNGKIEEGVFTQVFISEFYVYRREEGPQACHNLEYFGFKEKLNKFFGNRGNGFQHTNITDIFEIIP